MLRKENITKLMASIMTMGIMVTMQHMKLIPLQAVLTVKEMILQ